MPAYTVETSRGRKYDERYGFETHGQFRCAYGSEKFLIAFICIICFICMSAVSAFMLSWMTSTEQALFIAMAILVCWAILAAVSLVLIRFVMFGREYYYSADESKMTITGEAKTVDIFYTSVMDVKYEPIMLFGKQRGFRVNITARKSSLVFNMVYRRFDAHMTSEKTPFHILEEHAGLLDQRNIDLTMKLRREAMNDRERAYEDGMLERPTVRNERNELKFRNVTIKPLVSDDDMVITKGSFFVPRRCEIIIMLGTILVGVLSTLLCISLIVEDIIFLLVGIAVDLILVGVYRMIYRKEYTYTADGKEFRISDKNGRTEIIYYCDVLNVNYKPIKFLWRERGYHVDIITKYRTITYHCLFLANKRYQNTKDLPFHIIEERIQRGNNNV